MIIFCTGLYGPTLEQYLKQAVQLVKAQSDEMAHHLMTPSPSLIVTTAYLAISLLDFSNTQLIQNYPLVKHAAGIASLQPLRQSLASTYISSPVGGSVLSSIRPPPPSSSITYASRPAPVYSSSLPVTTTVVGMTTSHVVNPLPVSLAPPKVNRIVSKPKIVKADYSVKSPTSSVELPAYRPPKPNINYTSDPTYTYDPETPSKPFNYKYEYKEEAGTAFDLDAPADQIIDSLIYETETQGRKLVKVLHKLLKNKLLVKIIGSSDDDPCGIIPRDLDETVAGLIDAIVRARPQLIKLFVSIQEMKAYEEDTSKVIKLAGYAMDQVEPLVPIFGNLFKKSPGCNSTLAAAARQFDGIGVVLERLGRTDIAIKDNSTKKRLQQGGQASKVVGRVAQDLENSQFLNLCVGSPTFTRNAIKGVGGLITGFKDIAVIFNGGKKTPALQKLDNTISIINDGAVSIILLKYLKRYFKLLFHLTNLSYLQS